MFSNIYNGPVKGILLLTLFVISFGTAAQEDSLIGGEYPSEKIIKISNNKRIIILSNIGQAHSVGDFLTLLVGTKPLVRTLVGKTVGDRSGLKVVKIYDGPLWARARAGVEVRVIRGDDSYFRPSGSEAAGAEKELEEIEKEEDLYTDIKITNEDFDDETNDEGEPLVIENLVSMNFGYLQGLQITEGSGKEIQYSISWARELKDSFWGEVQVGRSKIKGYPVASGETGIDAVHARVLYKYELPFYSFAFPYVGYRLVNVNSPDAERAASQGNSIVATQLANLKEGKIIFGLTLLRRLVPGWYIRANLGNDNLTLGLTLEF